MGDFNFLLDDTERVTGQKIARPKTPVVPTVDRSQVDSLLDEVEFGLGEQESNNNPKARNKRTNATGTFQVLPSNIGPWTQKYLNRAYTTEEFKADPDAQRKVFRGEFGKYLEKALPRAKGDRELAVRMAAAGWYGGEGAMHRYDDPVRFRPDEPSFREYTTSVVSKMRRKPVTQGDFSFLLEDLNKVNTQPAGQTVADFNFLNEDLQNVLGQQTQPSATILDKQGNPMPAPTFTEVPKTQDDLLGDYQATMASLPPGQLQPTFDQWKTQRTAPVAPSVPLQQPVTAPQSVQPTLPSMPMIVSPDTPPGTISPTVPQTAPDKPVLNPIVSPTAPNTPVSAPLVSETAPIVPQPSPVVPNVTESDFKAWREFKQLPDTPETRAQFQADLTANKDFGSDVTAAGNVTPQVRPVGTENPQIPEAPKGIDLGAVQLPVRPTKEVVRRLNYDGPNNLADFKKWGDDWGAKITLESVEGATLADVEEANKKFPTGVDYQGQTTARITRSLEYLNAVADARDARLLGRISAQDNAIQALKSGFGADGKTLEDLFANGIRIEDLTSDRRFGAAVAEGGEIRGRFDSGVESYLRFDPNMSEFSAQVKTARDLGFIPEDRAQTLLETEDALLGSERERVRAALRNERAQGAATRDMAFGSMPVDEVTESDISQRLRDELRANGVASVTALNEKRIRDAQLQLERSARIAKELEYRPLYPAMEFAKSFGSLFAKIPGEALKIGGILDTEFNPLTVVKDFITGKESNALDSWAYRAGKEWNNYIDSFEDEDLKTNFVVNTLPKAISQITIQALAAAATGGFSLLYPLATAANEGYDAALEGGGGKAARMGAVATAAVLALPDAFLQAKYFDKIIDKSGFLRKLSQNLFGGFAKSLGENEARELTRVTMKTFLARAGKAFPAEITQEYTEDTGNEAYKKLTYKPDMSWDQVFRLTPERVKGYLAAGIGGVAGAGVSSVTDVKAYNEALGGVENVVIGNTEFKTPEEVRPDYLKTLQMYQDAASLFEEARIIRETPSALKNLKGRQRYRETLSRAVALTNEANALREKADRATLTANGVDPETVDKTDPMTPKQAQDLAIVANEPETPVLTANPLVGQTVTVKLGGKTETRVVQRLTEDGKVVIADENGNRVQIVKRDKVTPVETQSAQPDVQADPVQAMSEIPANGVGQTDTVATSPEPVQTAPETPQTAPDGDLLSKEQMDALLSEPVSEPVQTAPENAEIVTTQAEPVVQTESPTRIKARNVLFGGKRKPKAPAAQTETVSGTIQTESVKPRAASFRVETDEGTVVDYQPKVLDSSDILTSLDPGYPEQYQPRDRKSRAASKAQIAEITNKLNPARLDDLPTASAGRPLVIPVEVDGKTKYAVISGNGRVEAIRSAYDLANEPSKRYAEFANAKEQTGAARPVYVGVMSPDSVDLEKFSKEANKPETAAMSPAEQAVADSQLIDTRMMGLFRPGEDGEIHGAANRQFVRAFIGDVAGTAESGRLLTSEGDLNQTGVLRVRNAIFARAFGSSPEGLAALERMAESTDNNVKNITAALLARAPQFANLREAVGKGEMLPEFDISGDLARAMEKYAALRESGTTVEEYVAQGNLFGAETTPFQTRIIQVFDTHKRSAKAIRGILDNYFAAADGFGNPKQANMFGEVETVDVESVFEGATRAYENNIVADQQGGLFDENQGGKVETGRGAKGDDVSSESLRKIAGDANPEDLRRQTSLNAAEDILDFLPDVESRQDGDTVKLSLEAGELFRRAASIVNDSELAAEPNLSGKFLWPEKVKSYTDVLEEFAILAEEEGVNAKPITDIIDNINKAAAINGTVLVNLFDNAIPHERGHQTNYFAASPTAKALVGRVGGPDGQGNVDTFLEGKDGDGNQTVKAVTRSAFEKFFKRHGYDMTTAQGRAVIIEETWNYIQTGDGARLGLSPEQEAAFAYHYMKAFIAKHGSEVLDKFENFYKQYNLSTENLEKVRNEIEAQSKADGQSRTEGDVQRPQSSNEQTGKRSDRGTGGKDQGTPETGPAEDRRLSGQPELTDDSGENADPKQKKSRTPISLREKADLQVDDRLYTATTNLAQQAFADQQLDKGAAQAEHWFNENAADKNYNAGSTTAVGLSLINHYGRTGDIEAMNRVADKLVPMITEAAQAVQAMSLVSVYNPETAGAYATRIKKQRTGKDITAEEFQKAVDIATEMSEIAKAEGASDALLEKARKAIEELEAENKALTEAAKVFESEKARLNINLSDAATELRNLRRQLGRTGAINIPKPKTSVAKLKQSIESQKADLERLLASAFGNTALRMTAGDDLRSIAPELLTDDQEDALVKLTALEIINGKTYDETLQGIKDRSQNTLTDDQVKTIHAKADGLMRGKRELTDDQKAALKIRNDHHRKAEKFLKGADAEADKLRKAFLKKLGKDQEAASHILEAGYSGEYADGAIFAALARKTDPENLVRQVRENFPELDSSQVRQVMRDADTIFNTARENVTRLRLLAKQQGATGKKTIDRILEARRVNSIDKSKVTRKANAFYDGLSKTMFQSLVESAVAYSKANLLSAVKTHFKNILGNAGFQATLEGSRAISAVADIAASYATHQRSMQGVSPTGIAKGFTSLVKQDDTLKAMNKVSGIQAAINMMRFGDSIDNMSKLQLTESHLGDKLGPVGTIADTYINGVFRLLSAEDALFKVYAFRRSIEEQAAVMARNEGGTKAEQEARRKELLQKPTNVMQMFAHDYAEFSTFQNDNKISTFIAGIKTKLPVVVRAGGELLVPFDRTPTNILLRVLDHTPYGLARAGTAAYRLKNRPESAVKDVNTQFRAAVVKDLQNEDFDKLPVARQEKLIERELRKVFTQKYQREFSQLIGSGVVGSAVLVPFGFLLASMGLMAGAMSADSDDRDEKGIFFDRLKKGIDPGSILIPNVGRFRLPDAPASKAMIFGATMYEQAELARKAKKDALGAAMDGVKEATADTIFEQPLLRSTRETLSSRQTVGGFTGNIASRFIPASAMLNSISNITDPEARRKSGYSAKEAKGKSTLDVQGTAFQRQLTGGVPIARNYLNPVSTYTVPKAERGNWLRRLVRELEPLNFRSDPIKTTEDK